MIRVKNLNWIIVHLLFIIISSFYIERCNNVEDMSVVTLLQLIYAITIFVSLRVSPLNFCVVFILCMMLFNYGQTWLHAINLNVTDLQGYTNIFELFPDEIILTALRCSIVIINISLLLFVALNSYCKDTLIVKNRRFKNEILPFSLNAWRTIYIIYWGIVLLSNFQRALNVSQVGYVEGFTFDSTLLYTINLYIIPIVILGLKYCKKYKLKYIGALLPLIINEAIVILFVGNRGASLIRIIIVVIYCFSNREKKTLKLSHMLSLGALVILLMLVMPFISATRTDLLTESFWSFIVNNNPIVIFLSEFGSTLSTFCYAILAVEKGNGSNGMQMFACLLTIVPGAQLLFPNIAAQLQFSARLNHLFHIRGLGGSLIGELYFNFRYWGILIYGLIYIILTKLTRSVSYRQMSIYHEVVIYMTIFGVLTWVRGSIYDFVNALKIAIYFCIILWIIASMRKNIKKK